MDVISEDEIFRAYANLKSASQRLFEAKAKQSASERKLHDYEAYLLVSGKIDGKNEEIRGGTASNANSRPARPAPSPF